MLSFIIAGISCEWQVVRCLYAGNQVIKEGKRLQGVGEVILIRDYEGTW